MSDKPETEAGSVEAEPTAQEPQSLDDVDVSEIEAEINRRSQGDITDTEVVPVAASEPEEPEPQEAVAEEPEPEPEEDDDTASEPEPTPEDRLSSLERLVQEADLRRQAEAARNEHLRLMLDRRSGEVAHLKNQMQQPAPQSTEYSQEAEYREASQVEPVLHEARTEINQLKQERAKNAALDEFQRLQANHADFWNALDKTGNGERQEFEKSFQAKLATELQGMGIEDSAGAGDAKRTGSIVRAAYTAALAETRLEWLNRTQQKRRQAPPTTDESRKRKLAAAAGAATSRPTARPVPKTLDECSEDEIKAEIDRREALGIDIR